MKKIFILIFSFLLTTSLFAEQKVGKFLGAKDSTMPSWFLSTFLDLSEDIEELNSQNKRLILFIHQNSCPYCHRFITKNLEDKETKDTIMKHFGVLDVNMFGNKEITDTNGETYSEKEFAKKYNLQFTPTIIFYNEEAKQILRLNGYVNVEKFNLALKYIKDKQENKLSFQEYLTNNKTKKTAMNKSDLFVSSNNFARAKDSKEMAILFDSPNCADCEILHNKLLKNKTTIELLKKLDLYQVDSTSSKYVATPKRMILPSKDWVKSLNITNTPTIIFFDNKGDEIIRIETVLKNFHFQSIIDYVGSGAYKEEKEFQRYLTQRATKIREQGIDVNIWE